MSPTFAERITLLEAQQRRCEETRVDVENRLRRIERTLAVGLGALGTLQIILKFL